VPKTGVINEVSTKLLQKQNGAVFLPHTVLAVALCTPICTYVLFYCILY